MRPSSQGKILFFFILIMASSFSAEAIEIRLKSHCHAPDALVLLGDLAEVIDQEAHRAADLSSIPLFPSPSDVRIVRLHEIENVLSLKSIDVAQCRFTGAAAVKIFGATRRQRNVNTSQRTSPHASRLAQQRIEAAILKHLNAHSVEERPWQISATLDSSYMGLVAATETGLLVQGGNPPWVGRQDFTVQITTRHDVRRVPVSAVISLQDLVVVAIHPLRRGEVIQANHIELRPAPSATGIRDLVYRVEDVIGKETTRNIIAGQPIEQHTVRLPRQVHRGELVTVYAIASGVRVKTSGTVVEDGSQGDLVTVRSLDRQQSYLARVTGFQTVEVYAGGARVPPAPELADP